jgi:hypothetical protein
MTKISLAELSSFLGIPMNDKDYFEQAKFINEYKR